MTLDYQIKFSWQSDCVSKQLSATFWLAKINQSVVVISIQSNYENQYSSNEKNKRAKFVATEIARDRTIWLRKKVLQSQR